MSESPNPICPLCRETHESSRTLSFDGCGLNLCDMYRSRFATIDRARRDEYRHIGEYVERTLAAAPDLLAACQSVIDSWERGDLAAAARQCAAAIAKATGATADV